MIARRQQKQLLEDKKDAIFDITSDILLAGQPIASSHQVKLAVQEKRGLEVSTKQARLVFRKELHMGYRMARAVSS